MDETTGKAAHPNNLKRAIESSGRKRKWLAEQLGVSRVTLHRYEHGMYRVPAEHQETLLRLLPEFDGEMFPGEVLVDAA